MGNMKKFEVLVRTITTPTGNELCEVIRKRKLTSADYSKKTNTNLNVILKQYLIIQLKENDILFIVIWMRLHHTFN